jgi:hypothetical protein
MNTSTADAGCATITDQPAARQLRRSANDRMLAGVAALYIAAWLLIPEDGKDQPVAAAWIAGRQNRSR